VKSPLVWPPIPSFSGIYEVRNFIKSGYEMLKLSIQCTRFESNFSSCTGRSSENICSSQWVQALRQKKTIQDETQFTTKPKLVEKLVWVPVISFCKIFIPSYAFDALLCRNWPFSPDFQDNSIVEPRELNPLIKTIVVFSSVKKVGISCWWRVIIDLEVLRQEGF
jgi:hypothetical protein